MSLTAAGSECRTAASTLLSPASVICKINFQTFIFLDTIKIEHSKCPMVQKAPHIIHPASGQVQMPEARKPLVIVQFCVTLFFQFKLQLNSFFPSEHRLEKICVKTNLIGCKCFSWNIPSSEAAV